MAKGRSLMTVTEKSKLGFGDGAPSSNINGGRPGVCSLADFNIKEFLRLANRVLDGDEASMAALNDLKFRWEAKYGRGGLQRSGVASSSLGLRKAWCCLLSAHRNPLIGKQMEEREQRAVSKEGASSVSSLAFQLLPVFGVIPTMDSKATATSDVLPVVQKADVQPENSDMAMEVDDVVADLGGAADVMHDLAAEVICDVSNEVENCISYPRQPSPIPTGLFVGNSQFHASPNTIDDDKIAHAFHNSS
ncbi:UNVERIFIED_CONTAM: hypothetical protein Sindi_1653000 [Sesamum indicum]